MPDFRLRLLAPLLALSILCGCVGPVEPTGFLPDYANLARIKGTWVSIAIVGPIDTATTPGLIAANGSQWARAWTDEPDAELALGIEEKTAEAMYKALLGVFPAPTIITQESNLGGYSRKLRALYRLELAVTQIERGHGALRYFLGYYAGAAGMQVEFRLRDALDNRLLVIGAARWLAPGYAHNGLNPWVFSARHCLEKETAPLAAEVAGVVADLLAGRPLPLKDP